MPDGWQLATHQLEVFQALQDPGVDAVFDTAMTGDGKTLAAHLPVLRETFPFQPVFVYPTNELIRDQGKQAMDLQLRFSYAGRLKPKVIDSSEITALMQEVGRGRSEMMHLVAGSEIALLTNPDLFTLINDFAYTAPFENVASLAQKFNSNYRYVVFDEFHTYDAAQVTAVLDAIVLARSMAPAGSRPRHLFLSATPNLEFIRRLEDMGLSCRTVKGEYEEGEDFGSGYRRILQPITLDVESCNASEGGIVGWFAVNVGRVAGFYAQYPCSKGAVICNSVLSAKRLVRDLRESLPDVKIVENTGLSGKEARAEAMAALAGEGNVLLIATSTVDVGVDFRLNYLIFEALDAGSFIQRLGRLGRHEGFSTYQAISLLPSFLAEKIEEYDWQEAAESRRKFFAILNTSGEIFPKTQGFERYITRWGGVRAYKRLSRFRESRSAEQAVLRAYAAAAQPAFRLGDSQKATFNFLSRSRQWAVLQELAAFRSAGKLDVWVYDAATGAVTTMNVLRLVSGAEVCPLEKKEAERIAATLGVRFYSPALDLYFQIEGYNDERLETRLLCAEKLIDPEQNWNYDWAVSRRGFTVDAKSPLMGPINDQLRNLDLCTCVLPPIECGDVASARRRFRLPTLFDLHLVRDNTGADYVVSVGPDALLLDSLYKPWRGKRDEPTFVGQF